MTNNNHQMRASVGGTYPHHPLPPTRLPFNTHREVRMVAGFRNNPPQVRRWWHWLTDRLTSDPMNAQEMAAAEMRRYDDECRTAMCAVIAIIIASVVVWALAGGAL